MNTYRIYWNDGTRELIRGYDFIIAFFEKGYDKFDYQALICWEKV